MYVLKSIFFESIEIFSKNVIFLHIWFDFFFKFCDGTYCILKLKQTLPQKCLKKRVKLVEIPKSSESLKFRSEKMKTKEMKIK